MRVRKLKMRGFMTYKNEMEIDFTRLFDKRIFLISGPTGSGKTTIFDAIAFALYEEVPRQIDLDRLRSDYLTENDPYTYVELEFSIGERTYLIKRVPSQRAVELKRPKNISHKVEFYDISDGVKLLADRVQDARDLVKEIIGLDGSQFSKVMVLAQGQFQKFLKSKSDEKADLLSDIFKTDKYRAIQEDLKERASSSVKEIEAVDKDLNNIVSYNDLLKKTIDENALIGLDFEKILKDIKVSTEAYENTVKSLKDKEEALKKDERSLFEKIEASKNKNENIKSYKKSQEKVESLLKILDEKTREKKDLDLLDYARTIEIYEKRRDTAKDELKDLEKSLKSKGQVLEEKEGSLKDLGPDLRKLPDFKKDLDKEKIDLENKRSLKKDYEKYLEDKKDFSKIRTLEEKRDGLSKDILDYRKDLDELRKSYDSKRDEIFKLKDEIIALDNKEKDLEEKLKVLRKDRDKLGKNLAFEKSIKNLKDSYQIKKKERKEASLNKDLAFINKLIARLNEEGVCPVCGVNHDSPIKKHKLSDLDFEKIEKELSDIKLELEKSKALLKANKDDLSSSYSYEEIGNIIRENEDLEKSYKDLKGSKKKSYEESKKVLKNLKNDGLSKALDLEKKEENLKKVEDKLKDLDQKRASYLSQKDTMETVSLEDLIKDIGIKERSIENLSNFIDQTDKKRQTLEKDIEKLRSTIKVLKENKKKCKNDIESYGAEFDKKLEEKFESEKAYKSYLKNQEEIESKREENEAYFKSLEEEKTIRDGLIDFKDMDPVDLGALDQSLEKVINKLDELSKDIAKDSQALRDLKLSYEKIKKIKLSYERLKGEARLLKRLSDLANGKTSMAENREKIDFETFVLSFYFDKVLAFANKRFKKMTDGQFIMVRKKEATDKRTKSGLDIEIFDYNTGRLRPASTLSGGESFMASLSLALGLSDEIGAENGGIRIDTLFIDEGFGTLSKDYLENAIASIEKLSQEDRFVGLISHVDELKDAIDSKIEISYDPSEGSSIKVVV